MRKQSETTITAEGPVMITWGTTRSPWRRILDAVLRWRRRGSRVTPVTDATFTYPAAGTYTIGVADHERRDGK